MTVVGPAFLVEGDLDLVWAVVLGACVCLGGIPGVGWFPEDVKLAGAGCEDATTPLTPAADCEEAVPRLTP